MGMIAPSMLRNAVAPATAAAEYGENASTKYVCNDCQATSKPRLPQKRNRQHRHRARVTVLDVITQVSPDQPVDPSNESAPEHTRKI